MGFQHWLAYGNAPTWLGSILTNGTLMLALYVYWNGRREAVQKHIFLLKLTSRMAGNGKTHTRTIHLINNSAHKFYSVEVHLFSPR